MYAINIYRRVRCFRGSGDFVDAYISVCVCACAIISTCIRMIVNKERLEQMLAVKISQLSAKQLNIQNKHHDMFVITIFIKVDFSAIEVPVFWIKIDVVSTEKYSIHDLWLSLSFGAHRHRLCKIIRGAMERRSGGVSYWCAILIAHQIVMAKHGGSCVHFSGISTCGRTSRETVSHPQCPSLPNLCKISLPIYVIVTNKLLQPLTTAWYDSLVLSFSLLKI